LLAAGASAAKYTGEIEGDPETTVTLKVERSEKEQNVVGFKVKDLLIDCGRAGDARLPHAALDGEATVSRRGTFKLEARDQGVRMAVEGRVVGRLEVKGTLVYSGRTIVGDEEYDCASGRQDWVVSR
jgi:hypothetical protein